MFTSLLRKSGKYLENPTKCAIFVPIKLHDDLIAMKKDYQNRSGEYEKSYGSSSYNKDERASFVRRKADAAPSDAKRGEVPPDATRREVPPTPPTPPTEGKQKRRSLAKHPFFIWLLLVLISTAFTWIMEDESTDAEEQTEETFDDPWSSDDMDLEENLEEDIETVRDEADDANNDATNDVSELPESEIELSAIGSMDSEAFAPTEKDETVSDDDLSTLDALERRNHADVVKQAERAGVSTEGSTLEILERISRKEMENMKR